MIDCTVAQDLMLEAEPAELDGGGESELAAHIAACARCRAAARVILDAERKLGRALQGAVPRRPVHEAVRAAARRASLRRWMWRSAPLAAAAVLAMVLLGRRPPVQWEPPRPTLPVVGSAIGVEAPPGKSVAVFRTSNPDIVIFWFF